MGESRIVYYKLLSCFIIFLIFIFLAQNIHAVSKDTVLAASRKVTVVTRIKAEERGAPSKFYDPRAFYVDKESDILYVIVGPSGPIYKFDIKNEYKFIEEIGKDVKFSYLLDINVKKNGDVYAVDADENNIVVFNSQGEIKQIIKAKDNRKDKTRQKGVMFIDFNQNGDIFLTDMGGHGIQVLDEDGNYLYEIVKAREGEDEFGFPAISQLRLNSKDEVFVLDKLMAKIVKFNTKGKTLALFGGRGDIAGTFVDPAGITIDNKDRVYIVELLTGTIQVFDRDGNFLYVLVNEEGKRLILRSPSYLNVDITGTIYVLERMDNRITVLKFID
ncbi:MAG: hypothetical protein HY934_08385 [Candidatus Firestonebacteria bacterium]|nr:hypothetical protein [Candidatus Firestonebacteria bacterium]